MQTGAMYLAAVVGRDGVCFTTAAMTHGNLLHAVAEYVSERAPLQLWPADAAAVHEKLSRGDYQAGIDRYFAAVGDRWDDEWLVMTEVGLPENVIEPVGYSDAANHGVSVVR